MLKKNTGATDTPSRGLTTDEVDAGMLALADEHRQTWTDKPESYWLARLMQEVGELGSSLVGDHDDPVEHELRQISAIALNWLRHREQGDF